MNVAGLLPRECADVYPVREDSLLLASSATVLPGEHVLEVGCGLGLASLAAAREGARVVASDRNPRAVSAVREAARALSLDVGVVRADLLSGLRRFDVILFNPPYLPTGSEGEDPDPWQDMALNGGRDGLGVTRLFLREVRRHLQENGRVYLLVATVAGSSVDGLNRVRSLSEGMFLRVVGERRVEGEHLRVIELRPVRA